MSSATTAFAGYSHLFPGARVLVETDAEDLAQLPESFPVVFSDDSLSTARLLREDGRSWILVVEGYSTTKGTRLDERAWAVSAVEPDAEGLGLTLGSRLPSG